MSSFTRSIHVFLGLPFLTPPTTSKFLHLETQSPASLRSTCPNHLRRGLGIVGVDRVVRRGRLRWFGHVERKEAGDWVSKCRNLEVVGGVRKGRPRKTWMECEGRHERVCIKKGRCTE